MYKLVAYPKIILILYFFFYLIFPNLAIGQNLKKDIMVNLQNSLNERDFNFINTYFEGQEILTLKKKLSNTLKAFPNAKWIISPSDTTKPNNYIFNISITGSKVVNSREYIFDSNFNYHFLLKDGKIKNGFINNLLTTIRSDQKKVDLVISIPDKVLTGKNYDIDIIINNPLESEIIAGVIREHQENSILKESMILEPLSSGGLFKVTRAPSKPGIQIWSGAIAHPEGLISFTKTVQVLKEF